MWAGASKHAPATLQRSLHPATPQGGGHAAPLLPAVPMREAVPGPATHDCPSYRELRAGEDVHISYGTLGNDFLLLDYGFLVPGNPCDTVQLRFDRGLIEVCTPGGGLAGPGHGPGAGGCWACAACPARFDGVLRKRWLVHVPRLACTHPVVFPTAHDPAAFACPARGAGSQGGGWRGQYWRAGR